MKRAWRCCICSIVLILIAFYIACVDGDDEENATKSTTINSAGSVNPKIRNQVSLTDEQLWDIYYEAIAKLKPYEIPIDRVEHEKSIQPKKRGWAGPDGFSMVRYIVDFGTENDILISIEGYTGEVRDYRHRRFLQSGPTIVYPKYVPLGTKPKLTPKQVKELTIPYLSLSTDIPLSEYEVYTEYGGNVWYVRFRRTHNGHPYEYDAIYMYYSEKYGLLSYHNCLYSYECDDTDAKIAEKKAWTAADKYVETIMEELKKEYVFAVMQRGKQDDEHTLKIVNPIFAAHHTRPPWLDAEITLGKARKTRLAWVFVYWSKPGTGSEVMLHVYVDAINGKLLGYKYTAD